MDQALVTALEREAASLAGRTDPAGRRRAAEVAAALREARGEESAPRGRQAPRERRA
jgi:hypothetical protein